MGKSQQIAFQIDNESLNQIDALTPTEFASRAEVLRAAVHEWLARRRSEAIDAALARGYGLKPQGAEEDSWADLSLEAIRAADLDW